MEFSDTDYERVVAKIFDNAEDHKGIRAQKVMQKISPYIGSDRTEFLLLNDILDPLSANPKIDRETLKTALLHWTQNLRSEKDSCIIEDVSILSNYDPPEQYTSFSTMSSEGYKERIAELQNDLAEKEHLVKKLKKQLEHSAQVTQQHEESLTSLMAEREKLASQLALEQSNNASSASIKQEYEDVVDALSSFKERSSLLEANLDNIKKDNFLLNNKVTLLENEKHSISQLLSKTKEDKIKVTKLLSTAQGDIEMLKKECVQFTEKIYEQEKTIQQLKEAKYSLEVDLQNSINKSTQFNLFKMDDSFEDKNTQEPDNLKNDMRKINCLPGIKLIDSECSLGEEYYNIRKGNCYSESIITSTPRNHYSLMQELNQAPESISDTTNYQHFSLALQPKASPPTTAAPAESTTNLSSNSNSDPFNDDSPELVNSLVKNEHTYIVSQMSKKNSNNKFQNDEEKIANLEKELSVQRISNKSLILKLNKTVDELLKVRCIVQFQDNRISQMLNYQDLLRCQSDSASNSINEATTRIKMLRLLNQQKLPWLRMRLQTPNIIRETLEMETQTDLTEIIENNALVEMNNRMPHTSHVSRSRLTRSIRFIWSGTLNNILFWGTCMCVTLAYLQLYSTMKYCSALRQGSRVRFYPWEWASINEIILSVFEHKHTGPVPF